MPAMPLNGHESHHVASEGNCPKAEDSDGLARWALGMLRTKSPEEARTPENSLRLYEAIGKEVSLLSLITRLLKVRRLRATTHAMSRSLTLHLTKLVRRRCPRIPSTSPPSPCCSLRWPLSRAAGSKRGLGLAWFPGHQAERPAADASRGPAAPVTAVPWPPPCQLQLTLSRRENCTALGKLVDADAYVEYVTANGR